jgi:Tol biopolymer transport system component
MNFFTKYQRVFMIIGFLLLVVAIGYLLYSLFVKPSISPAPAPTPVATSTTGKLPNSGQGGQTNPTGTTTPGKIPNAGNNGQPAATKAAGGITQTPAVSNNPAISPTTGANGSGIQYYDQTDGKFYRIDNSGNVTPLSGQVFNDVSNVVWAPQKDKAIIEYPDNSKILYNFTTQKQTTLPANWNEFDFSGDGSQIVLKSSALDPENNYLAISNADGTGQQIIEPVGTNGNTVVDSWSPNNQTIAMYTQGVDLDRQEVFFVGKNDENFKSMIVEGHGFQPQWSPKGDQLAYSVYSSATDMKPELWAVDAQGNAIGSGRRDLDVATFADKCVFADNSTMYCGVPQSMPTGAGLFPELTQNTPDNLYKIDIQTGAKELVAIPNGNYTMSNLSVSADGSSLFFQDSNTKIIHKVELK